MFFLRRPNPMKKLAYITLHELLPTKILGSNSYHKRKHFVGNSMIVLSVFLLSFSYLQPWGIPLCRSSIWLFPSKWHSIGCRNDEICYLYWGWNYCDFSNRINDRQCQHQRFNKFDQEVHENQNSIFIDNFIVSLWHDKLEDQEKKINFTSLQLNFLIKHKFFFIKLKPY